MVAAPTAPVAERFRLSPPWLASAAVADLFALLHPVGEARVVGGAVRNAVLGEPPGDIDFATIATPERVAAAAAAAGFSVHETGLAHGTLTLVVRGRAFEVTTLREDVSTDGRRATVRFTRDWARDAGRRDFTMNALYLDRAGIGYDYVGGHADCLARRVRFIGDAGQRIREDHLRILRFFRFHAAYGHGPPDADGLAAVRIHKELIARLAAERVRHEVMRLLVAPGAAPALDILVSEDFLRPFAPDPLSTAAFRALAAAHATAGGTIDPVLALVALVGHSQEAFVRLAEALKLSRRERARGLTALAAAQRMPPRSMAHARALVDELGSEAFVEGLLLAVSRGMAVPDLAAFVETAHSFTPPPFPLSGHDLLRQGGSAGPQVGQRLDRLRALWRQSDFALDKDALLASDRDHLDKTRQL